MTHSNFTQAITKSPILWMLFLLTTGILFSYTSTIHAAPQQQKDKYAISLQARIFIPATGIDTQMVQRLKNIITQEKQIPHILLQLKHTPTRSERVALQTRGVKLLSHAGGNAWHASLTDTPPLLFVDPINRTKYPILNTIRWIGQLTPNDKVHSLLREKGAGDWATNPDGTIKVSINFYSDVTEEQAQAVLSRHGAQVESKRIRRMSFYIVINPSTLDSLAGEDNVKFITFYPPPKQETNTGSRAWTNTDNVHAEVAESNAAINIEGNGNVLGIWDGNEVDDAHDDLTGRVVFGEVPRTNTTRAHSTHVACTMAGNGAITANRRGHAPQTNTIVTYDYNDSVPAEMTQAIEDHAIIAANNSWGYTVGWNVDNLGNWVFTNNQGLFGDYLDSADFDTLVRDDNLSIVFAVGNDRNDPAGGLATAAQPADWDQGSANAGFDTLIPPSTAKNVISVGAINDATGAMSTFSNWGPTDDGRLKPDLVGPGVAIWSCDDNPDDVYYESNGTSMAAPAVTGITALLIQTYRDEFFADINSNEVPLPSTIKTLLIHSAQDMGRPGPDYEFGWGGVDAQAAYQLIRNRQVIESEFYDTAEQDQFVLDVPAGQANLRVSICWDDVEGIQLINDIDLSLQAPDNTIHSPWLLDPAPANWDNNAGTGVDRDNNCEQVFVNGPAAGHWKITVDAHAINEPVTDPVQKYSLVASLPFYQEDSVSVVQVIDRTGSMDHRDDPADPTYMESAKVAAQNFIGLMHLGDEAGVVAFDVAGCNNAGTKAESVNNLVELTTDVIRDNVANSVTPITDRGCTSIGAGMQLAQDGPHFLDEATVDQPHAMIVLTDGYENQTPWVRTRPPAYAYLPETPNNILLDIPLQTDVYTIALGPSSDSDLMRDIADTTGGKFYEAPTILGLLSIYYQIHSDVALADITGIESGEKSAGNDTRTTTVDEGSSEVTFMVGWLQSQGRLELRLEDPNNQPVSVTAANVQVGSYNNHYYIRIKNPLPGDWSVRLLRMDQQSSPVKYTYAAFLKGASKFWSFVPEFTFSGECLIPKVRLFESGSGQAIRNANVKAIVSSPSSSKYTLNYDYVIANNFQWNNPPIIRPPGIKASASSVSQASADISPNWVSNLMTYNQQSIANTGNSIFQYNTQIKALLDDGEHNDGALNDGSYANCIDTTQIAGNYNIRFEVSGVTAAGKNFQRAALSTAAIAPEQIDSQQTYVAIDSAHIDVKEGSKGVIAIVPRDHSGNVWGPGHAPRINVNTTAGVLLGNLRDNGDGFYFHTIQSTGNEASGQIVVTIDGETMASQPDVRIGPPSFLSASLHIGATAPQGSFNNLYDNDISLALDIDYHFSNQLSAVAILGYNRFKAASPSVSDTYWLNLSANLKYEFTPNTWRPYVNGGVGLYDPKSGSSEPGVNLGLGVDFDINPNLVFEAGIDYHRIFTSGDDTNFNVFHIGLIHYY